MPDIFGREPGDYPLVRHLQEEGMWDRYQRSNAQARPQSEPVHNFAALGEAAGQQNRAADDAQALGYLTNNLLAVQTMVDDVLYQAYRLPRFLSLNTAIAEGAQSYGIRVRDRRGQAARVSAPGYDAPSASGSEFLVTQEMHWYGIDAEWSLDELRGAMFAGVALDTETINDAVSGMMDTMEAVGLTGGDYAEKGIFNQPHTGTGAVTRSTASAKWNALTTDVASTIRKEITDELSGIIEDSKETFGRTINTGMTVFLPGPQYDQLSVVYVGDNADRTLLKSLLEDNPWTNFSGQPLGIERVLELKGIGPSGVDRMVTTLRNPRVAEMGVSISPRVLKIMDKGRVFCAQVEGKFSPVFVKRPNVIRYRDGI